MEINVMHLYWTISNRIHLAVRRLQYVFINIININRYYWTTVEIHPLIPCITDDQLQWRRKKEQTTMCNIILNQTHLMNNINALCTIHSSKWSCWCRRASKTLVLVATKYVDFKRNYRHQDIILTSNG